MRDDQTANTVVTFSMVQQHLTPHWKVMCLLKVVNILQHVSRHNLSYRTIRALGFSAFRHESCQLKTKIYKCRAITEVRTQKYIVSANCNIFIY